MKYTSDIVLLHRDDQGRLWVLQVQREWDPFAGMWALPGGFVEPGEEHIDAGVRELGEETGLPATRGDLVFVGRYDKPGRDPRGPVTTEAFAAVLDQKPTPTAADDARAARWVLLETANAEGWAFDHADIVNDAIETARSAA